MKKLPLPTCNDESKLKALADNNGLASISPQILHNTNAIKAQYQHYLQVRGNAWNIIPNIITPALEKALLDSYSSRQDDELKFMKNMRDTNDNVCPMCGSKFPWSLDHVLPKAEYPEWAIFSKNLVPACTCNIKRGVALKGNSATKARVLHPYFDDTFETRQLSCLITTTNNFRYIKAEITYLQPNHPELESIKYHVNKIVKASGIDKYLTRTLWGKMITQPSLAVSRLYGEGTLNQDEVRALINKDLGWYDATTGTPNNWDSIFLHGILNSPNVLSFITRHHNQFVRNGGLVI